MVTLPANPFCLKIFINRKLAKKCGNVGSKNSWLEITWLEWQMQRKGPAIDDDVRLRLFTGIKFCSPQLLIMIRLTEAKLGLICVLIQPYRHLVSRNNV